jgi:hypothetical protein
MAYFKILSQICLEGLRKITTNLCPETQSPGWGINPGPPEYEVGELITQQWHLVSCCPLHIPLWYLPIVVFWVDMKMKVVCSSKLLVTTYKPRWHHNPEDHNQHLHCCENLKSLTIFAWNQHGEWLQIYVAIMLKDLYPGGTYTQSQLGYWLCSNSSWFS